MTLGSGIRQTSLYGKPYIWVRDEKTGKMSLKRIIEADYRPALEEHFKELGLDPALLDSLKMNVTQVPGTVEVVER